MVRLKVTDSNTLEEFCSYGQPDSKRTFLFFLSWNGFLKISSITFTHSLNAVATLRLQWDSSARTTLCLWGKKTHTKNVDTVGNDLLNTDWCAWPALIFIIFTPDCITLFIVTLEALQGKLQQREWSPLNCPICWRRRLWETRAKAPPVSIQRESGYEMLVVYLRD